MTSTSCTSGRPGQFTYVPGYFLQDEADDHPLPAVPARFGLRDASDDRWSTFFHEVERLNRDAPPGVSYKFILLSRHGQGFHNVAESKYGTIAWDDYWSKLNGDGEIVWGPDPELTSLGISQAQLINETWRVEVAVGIPSPNHRFCSPLTRALHTCQVQFEGVFERPPVQIVEYCREENGVHTCDKRRSKTYISSRFPPPIFEIEKGLTEEDELWDADIRETHADVAHRARKVLQRIFDGSYLGSFLTITTHGGFINGFLQSVGRNRYPLPTGGVMPLVVRYQTSPES